MVARRWNDPVRARDAASVPALDDNAIPLHPVMRAMVALALGVGLGILAALFIPRRKGE